MLLSFTRQLAARASSSQSPLLRSTLSSSSSSSSSTTTTTTTDTSASHGTHETVYGLEPGTFADALNAETVSGTWVGWSSEAHSNWFPDAAGGDTTSNSAASASPSSSTAAANALFTMLGDVEESKMHYATLVRPITTAVIKRLRALGADPASGTPEKASAHERKHEMRRAVVLTGVQGIGKTTLSNTAVAWAKSAGWIVIHAPSAVEVVRGRGMIAPSSLKSNSELPAAVPVATQSFDHPIAAVNLLKRLRTDYSQQLAQIQLLDTTPALQAAKTLVSGAAADSGSSLADAVEVARTRPGDTMVIFDAVFAALAEQTDVPVLVAINDVDVVYGTTGFTSPTGLAVHGPQLTHVRAMLSLARTVKRGAGLFTTSLNDLSHDSAVLHDAAEAAHGLRGLAAENPKAVLRELALEKARAEAVADGLEPDAYDDDAGEPTTDEVFAARRAVDKRLAKHGQIAWEAELKDTLGARAARYSIPPLSREETGAILDRLAAADAIAPEIAADPVSADSIHVLCSGIPGEVVDMASGRFE